jgi:hypothetical protein
MQLGEYCSFGLMILGKGKFMGEEEVLMTFELKVGHSRKTILDG